MTEQRIDLWKQHWQDEGDAAYLYRRMAAVEPDQDRARLFRDLAEVEDRHQARWRDILHGAGVDMSAYRPSSRARLQILLGRVFGWKTLVSLLLAEEGRETKSYLQEATHTAGPAQGVAQDLARESAEHAGRLGRLLGVSGEPWHHTESGGFLRNAVYGFNDGLTANFGLVMGVLGANIAHHIVLLSGIAGLIADALSMGSSSFLAAKSEQEVYAHEIALEREELQMMPDLEEDELVLLYKARGLAPQTARETAKEVMRHPERALQEQTQLELGISPAAMSPLREGWITGLSTAVGACIPVLPFALLPGNVAIWVSFGVSMLSHFGVGAARSIFTGRGVFRSGLDMFVVGLGVALIGYVVGGWVSRLL
ncbi:MAG: VIT1/CCC1 transporter family protein [Armatimonadota bacterium]